MNKHRWLWLTLGLVTLIIVAGGWWILASSKADAPDRIREKSSNADTSVPTLFIHGYGGGTGSTDQMINSAQKSGLAAKVATATVDKDGKVTLTGKLSAQDVNPMIQVLFKDNRDPDYNKLGSWVKAVLVALEAQHRFRSFNVVSHSMGNNALLTYELNQASSANNLPVLKRWVSIAGPFNGLVGQSTATKIIDNQTNQPDIETETFKIFKAKIAKFPSKVEILNIFGDLKDGSDSDQRVTTASARSLGNLLKNQVTSYQEVRISGKKGQHSQLHENQEVDQKLQAFLWKN